MHSTEPLVRRFPCPGCGASLEFNPKAGMLKCPYCGREEVIPQSAAEVEERSYDDYLNTGHTQIAALSKTAQEAECPGCHALIAFEPPDVAGRCPFCSTNIVVQAHSAHPMVTPEGVLPFQLDQKAAHGALQKWLGSRWFAPNKLKQMAQHERMQGVYLPFWTYDCNTISYYHGQRGTHYYVTETYTVTNSEGKIETKTRQVQHTRWHPVSGRVSRFFDDVLIPASQAVKDYRLERLTPWDLSKLVPYDSSYLTGFKAQRYQVDLKQGFELAKPKMEGVIQGDVRRDIGGDEQRIDSVSTSYSAITFKHILLPLWMAAYRYQNKQYQVLINAQTGKIDGDRPYSKWKVIAAILLASAAVMAVNMIRSRQEPPLVEPTPIPTVQPSPVRSPNSPTSSAPSQPVQADELYRQAINTAGNAATATQSAQTQADWQAVAAQWKRAIELLNAVSPSSQNYSMAQQKIQEYQRNLDYANQQAAIIP